VGFSVYSWDVAWVGVIRKIGGMSGGFWGVREGLLLVVGIGVSCGKGQGSEGVCAWFEFDGF